jgi:glutathione synthase/RimK-type ligase-like ATP-grasp enzyme
MAIKLFTIKSEHESAKRLGFPTSMNLENVTAKKHKDDIIIRWGRSCLVYEDERYIRTGEFTNVLNPSEAIRRNCNKRTARDLMSEVVTTPKTFRGSVPAGITAVLRPLEHAAGRDFIIKKGPYAFDSGWYATEFLKTDEEYRVWFCGGATFYAKRVALHGEDENNDYPCRSNWGYSYRDDVPLSLHRDTLAAAQAIGLEFGAADVLKYNGRYYFLELNSAPSIDTHTLERFFKNNLTLLMQKKFPKLV